MKKMLHTLLFVIGYITLHAQDPVYKLSNDPSGNPGKDFVVTIEWPSKSAYTNVSLANAFIGVLFNENTTLSKTDVQGTWTNSISVDKTTLNGVCGSSVNPQDYEFQHYNMNAYYQFGNRTSGGSDTLFKLKSSVYVSTGKIQLMTNLSPSGTVDACLFANGVKNTGTIDPAYPSVSTGYDIVGTGGSLALPVKLLNLDAEWADNNSLVTWSTASEENNSHFIVERSFDGYSYSSVGTVYSKAPNGNSSEILRYQFIDFNAKLNTPNQVYYRLVQVDFNGDREKLGPVVLRVEDDKPQNITVYPNPTNDVVNVDLSSKPFGAAEIRLLDMAGRLIESREYSPENNIESFKVDHLDRGFYFISIVQANYSSSTIVLVR